MKIVECIDAKLSAGLTLNKVYDVLEETVLRDEAAYIIEDDRGIKDYYFISRFRDTYKPFSFIKNINQLEIERHLHIKHMEDLKDLQTRTTGDLYQVIEQKIDKYVVKVTAINRLITYYKENKKEIKS